MSNEKKLRIRMFGYNPKDVHEYISELSTNTENTVKKYMEQIESLNVEIQKLTSETKKYMQHISELDSEVEKMNGKAEDYNSTISVLKRDNADALARIAAFETERKAVSDVLISAKNQAGSIVLEAKTKADDELTKVKAECDEQRHLATIDLNNAKREIERTTESVINIKKDLIAALEKCNVELDSIIAEKVGK